jgi:hypothetical protein
MVPHALPFVSTQEPTSPAPGSNTLRAALLLIPFLAVVGVLALGCSFAWCAL